MYLALLMETQQTWIHQPVNQLTVLALTVLGQFSSISRDVNFHIPAQRTNPD